MVRVVEPKDYAPPSHGSIFEQVVSQLISPAPLPLERGAPSSLSVATPFDLLTFPEAFAPVTALLSVLQSIRRLDTLGCIHVGLRPTDEARHLFSVGEIEELVTAIQLVAGTVADDLAVFSDWLKKQPRSAHFNLGCLFTLDANRRVRICLHPKLVRSHYEHKALVENHLEEADLVTLVTLMPVDNRFFSVTIQPLICSDALNLATDRGTPPPIGMLNSTENPFVEPPDHIDLVSVATCTPQVVCTAIGAAPTREWHQDFRDSFCRAAETGEWPRHHFATFILSNFENVKGSPAGLSGLFQPIEPKDKELRGPIHLACYGRNRITKGNNRWSIPDASTVDEWDWRGYIAALSPSTSADAAAVRVFGFSLATLLRDTSLWKPARGLAKCEVLLGRWEGADRLKFDDWKDRADG